MIRRRVGRPGLLGTAARTAVIAGTATAVSGNVQRRAAGRAADQQQMADYQQQQLADQAAAQAAAQLAAQQQAAAPAAPAASTGEDRIAQLTKLAELKSQGILTDGEFAAEKARILNS
ncbi:regulator of protease activity HflC (stomatin/prohibitin superfamily) [Streptacidiphilus sp. MAP12-33]|uniref:SHOCT domain-containing protein n=1 Tax=Streptacidiphilus sp. MAP12-33 TaxID=3156266 RepID=UPI00351917F3